MNRLLLEAQMPVEFESVRELRHLLEQVILPAVPYISIRHKILLCLSEAATNLVLHARPEAKQISMRFSRNNHNWWLEILDDGTPWDPSENTNTDCLTEFSTIENGRGTALLQSQCKQIEYTAGDSTKPNYLKLSWDIPAKNENPTILVVEDDKSLRRLYSAYLENDFEILSVANGHEAIAQLKTEKIDLVLSDINMPEMSGFSLREHLSQGRDTALIPFIFVTAIDDEHIKKSASGLGIDDYLIKPVDKTQLLNIIHRVLKRSRQVYRQLTERIDKQITSTLAPTLPEISHGWRLCVANRNTGIGGGDLLLHRNSENQLMLVLVDIMGHDDSAKFFAYAYCGYLRGLMQTCADNTSPSQILEKLSASALQDDLLSQVILTSCAITLSPEGLISISAAGHPPPIMIKKTGAEILNIGGMLPGLLPDTIYHTRNMQLSAGERIAFYTDGLFESSTDAGTQKERETNITNILIETLNDPIEHSLQQVMSTFDEFAGTPPRDDALLLLMEPIK